MRKPRGVVRMAILSTCAVFCAAGCASRRPAAPVEPPLRAVVSYSLGSPLDPPVAAAAAPGGAAAAAPLNMTLRGYAADASSLPAGAPLAAKGQLIIDSVSEPMATAPPATEAVRLVADASSLPAQKSSGKGAVVVEEVVSPLPPGCTAVISFVPNPPSRAVDAASTIRLAIVSPSAAGADRPRLLVTARPQQDAPLTQGEAAPALRERTMLLEWPLDGPTGEFVLIFPAPRGHGVRRAAVFRVRIDEADANPQAVQASARILADLGKNARPAVASRGQILAAALASASKTPGLRRTMTALCAEVQGDVALESSLLLDDKGLASAAAPVADALAAAPPELDTAQLGWLADRAVLGALAKMSAGGEVAGGVRAMLSARYGEVGRDAGGLAELAAASASRADFDARVRAENVILLDDASPASRVRAFEWTSRQDAKGALKGYDPLGPTPQRRQAIDNYLQSLTAPTQPTQPTARAEDAPGGRHE